MQCPACKARYLVPDSAIGEGRTVRCAKCSNTWFQTLPQDAPPLGDLDIMLKSINAKAQPIPEGSNLPVVQKRAPGWGMKISVSMLAGIAAVMVVFVSTPKFFGFQKSQGLVLADLAFNKQAADDQHTTYQISAKISNTATVAKRIPIVRVTLVDSAGKALQSWDYPGAGALLQPGEAAPFSSDNLEVHSSKGTRFVVELGNPLELALRRKPDNSGS